MIDIKNCFTYAYSDGSASDFEQAVSANADATNVLDLIGASSPTTIKIAGGLKHSVLVVKAKTVSGAGYITIDLVMDTDPALDTVPVVVLRHQFNDEDLIAAAAADGVVVNIPLPNIPYLRYLGIEFTISTTIGTFTAYLSDGMEPATDVAYEVMGT